MSLQNIKSKRIFPNIIAGLIFGLLAMHLQPSYWSYFFFILSVLFLLFTDKLIREFKMKCGTGRFHVKGGDIDMIHRDREESIKSKSK